MRRIPETTPVLRELEIPPRFEIHGAVADGSGRVWLPVAPHADHFAIVAPLVAIDGSGRIVSRAENGRLARAGLPIVCDGSGMSAVVGSHERATMLDRIFHWRVDPDGRVLEETLLAGTPSKISLGASSPSVTALPSAHLLGFPSAMVVETNGRIRWRSEEPASLVSGDFAVRRTGDGYEFLRLSDGAPAGSVATSSNWIYPWLNHAAISLFSDDDGDGSGDSSVTVHDVSTGRPVFTARGVLSAVRRDAPVICVTESTNAASVERRFTPDGGLVAEIVGSRGRILELDDRFLLRHVDDELVCETIAPPIEHVWRVAAPDLGSMVQAFATGGTVVLARHLQQKFVLTTESA